MAAASLLCDQKPVRAEKRELNSCRHDTTYRSIEVKDEKSVNVRRKWLRKKAHDTGS